MCASCLMDSLLQTLGGLAADTPFPRIHKVISEPVFKTVLNKMMCYDFETMYCFMGSFTKKNLAGQLSVMMLSKLLADGRNKNAVRSQLFSRIDLSLAISVPMR